MAASSCHALTTATVSPLRPAAARFSPSSSSASGWSGSRDGVGVGVGVASDVSRGRHRRRGRGGPRRAAAVAAAQHNGGARSSRRRPGPQPLHVIAPSAPSERSSPRADEGVDVSDDTSLRLTPAALRVDFLVIGSGISGLSYALEAAEVGNVAVVTKDVAYEGSTHYAQGGIASVISTEDTVEEHVRDTHVAGDFLCDEAAVEVLCREGREAVDKLIQFGANFTKDDKGDLHLAREGGHSKHRIVHTADMTGKEIERALLESAMAHPNITFYEHHMAQDLITVTTASTATTREGQGQGSDAKESGTETVVKCLGADITRRATGEKTRFLSCCTLLAAGGAGQLFPSTTNPSVSTGDGVAMAVRAHAAVANMEFYQFHPTSLYTGPGGARKKEPRENAFLVTEAVRGHGGHLFNADGERFMASYDDRLELAPRDVVARAIDCEIKAAAAVGHEAACVYLDVSHLPPDDVLANFPGIAAELASRGINMTVDRIPVVPAAHYLCGGVLTDLHGQTTVEGLFACGETACTGVHGANRLASNSLLEAAVFANRAVKESCRRFAGEAEALEPLFRAVEDKAAAEEARRVADAAARQADASSPSSSSSPSSFDEDVAWAREMRAEVQGVMWGAAGIVRDTESLRSARAELEALSVRCEVEMKARGAGLYAHELRNLITVGLVTLCCASMRKESRGLHYNVDYPDRVEEQRRMTLVTPDVWRPPSSTFTSSSVSTSTTAGANDDDGDAAAEPSASFRSR